MKIWNTFIGQPICLEDYKLENMNPKPTHTSTVLFLRPKFGEFALRSWGFHQIQEILKWAHVDHLPLGQISVPKDLDSFNLGGFKINNKINM